MNVKEKLEKCLQIVSKPNASLKDLKKIKSIEAETNSKLSDEEKKKAVAENREIISQIAYKFRQIVNEFTDKWSKGEIFPGVEDLEVLEKSVNEINESIEDMIFSICRVIYRNEDIEKRKNFQEAKNKDKELRDKIISLLFQHEKERLQSSQPITSKNQSKNDYPWGIIISMGAAMAALLGVIIFLLVRKKNKKNE